MTEPTPTEEQVREAFWRKVDKLGRCWKWKGFVNDRGYGIFYFGDRGQWKAHRVAYTLSKSAIPDGFQIDHLCRNRSCVNPEHLEAVTQKENILRGLGITANLARKTHCKKGHLFNRVRRDNGSRECSICSNATKREYYWKNVERKREQCRSYYQKHKIEKHLYYLKRKLITSNLGGSGNGTMQQM